MKPLTCMVMHHQCGGEWEVYSKEIPPKVVICTKCSTPLKLVGKSDDGMAVYANAIT